MSNQKKIPKKENFEPSKKPINNQNPEEYKKMTPYWSFSKFDTTHEKWGFKLEVKEYHDLIDKLKSYEGMTWLDIELASGGKKKGGGTNNHPIPVSQLIKEAQLRLQHLKLDDYDELFSLRLCNLTRVFGIRNGRVLNILWHDCNHEICTSKK